MAEPRKFHLFNCDSIYDLNVVEDLLKATKAKLGFEFSVEKHNFTLSEMSELSTKTIPEMRMDFARFVVHAHESGLFINHDNLEYGYTKVYQALLQATGGNVINVIGGDDNYKDQEEEDRDFISRWAKRKICSQFREEFLDGRKGFIFSWNKRHRAIHEAALLHYFDLSRKGQKFQYQPPQRKPSKAVTPPPVLATEPVHLPRLYRSFTLPEERIKQMNDKQELPSSRKSPLQKDQAVSGQRIEDIQPYTLVEARREDPSVYKFDTTSACTTPFYRKQGARPKEMLPPSLERPKPKDLAILGCNVLQSSMQDARKVFQDIVPKLNLSEPTPIVNFPSLIKVKEYLMDNHLRCCVLMIDADQIKYAHEHLLQGSSEYRQLLETAANHVDDKVIILICGSHFLSQKDEAHVEGIIKRFINETEKVFHMIWLKSGKLTVDPNVILQFMSPTSGVAQPSPLTLHTGSSWPTSASSSSAEAQRYQKPRRTELSENSAKKPHGGEVSQWQSRFSPAEKSIVMLKSKLPNGIISYQLKDLEIMYPGFRVPDYISQLLLSEYCDTSVAEIRIASDDDGKLRWFVEGAKSKELPTNEGIEIAANETLMLSTCVRYGKVSLEKDDLQFIYPGWQIPEFILNSLKCKYGTMHKADLYVISDEQGKLRYKVHVMVGAYDKILGAANLAWRAVTNYRS